MLTMYDESLSDCTREKLTSLGVEVRTDCLVKDIEDCKVILENETIEAENIIWAAGVEAPSLTRDLGVELDPGGRIIVEGDLSIPGHPEVFALGDIAHCIDQADKRVPGGTAPERVREEIARWKGMLSELKEERQAKKN